ncbi:MAG TPA: hypothetical protein VFB60_13580 [Ktedonobacteraceae bacterium]|nr:hypothetical protein [Ktedonobacteraceae bacterium]
MPLPCLAPAHSRRGRPQGIAPTSLVRSLGGLGNCIGRGRPQGIAPTKDITTSQGNRKQAGQPQGIAPTAVALASNVDTLFSRQVQYDS